MILTIIGAACIGYLWVHSEPTTRLRNHLGFNAELYSSYGKIKQLVIRLITCPLCISFWIGLLLTSNILYAAITAVLAQLITNNLNKF